MRDNVVLLPWLGEFGWMVIKHLRYVHHYPAARKIVCAAPGHECLYPSADEFFTDWENPIPDGRRWNDTDWKDSGAKSRFYDSLVPRLAERYPGHEVVAPRYPCHWHASDAPGYKFCPVAASRLPAMDVVIAPRKRSFDEPRNWPYWETLVSALRSDGLHVGIAGRADTSYDIDADGYAWDHPDGDTAGTVDLLSRCRLYVGGDSGITHLACLMDASVLVLTGPATHPLVELMRRANKGMFEVAPGDQWGRPKAIAARTRAALENSDRQGRYDADLRVQINDSTNLTFRLNGLLEAMKAWEPGRIRSEVIIPGATKSDLRSLHAYRNRFFRITCTRRG